MQFHMVCAEKRGHMCMRRCRPHSSKVARQDPEHEPPAAGPCECDGDDGGRAAAAEAAAAAAEAYASNTRTTETRRRARK
eukprot:817859-Lingulodinium_polyedra.AAC.1